MTFSLFIEQSLNGVQLGVQLFLMSAGLTLVFGIMNLINLAHGSLYLLGAYIGFVIGDATGSWVLAVLAGFISSALVGLFLQIAVFRFMQGQDLRQTMVTIGISIVLADIMLWIFGGEIYQFDPPNWMVGTLRLPVVEAFPVYRVLVLLAAIVIGVALWWFLNKTRVGMMIRAGSTNREMVQSLGIDIQFLYRVVFAAGVAIAVLAGMVAAPVSSVYPGMGNQVLIICFVVVVIGGIGSIRGALLAAMLIGFVDTFGKVLLPQAAGVLVYVLMALILLWKPDGLFKAG